MQRIEQISRFSAVTVVLASLISFSSPVLAEKILICSTDEGSTNRQASWGDSLIESEELRTAHNRMYRIVRVSPQEGHIGVGFSIDETREKITKTKQAKAETEEALKKWDEWLKPKEPTTREQFETTELQYWYRSFYGNKDDLHSQRTVIDRIDGSAFQKYDGYAWDDKKNRYVNKTSFHLWAGVCKLFDKRKHVKF